MKHYGLLVTLLLFSSSIHSANCIPKVTDKKVTVEYFDGNGNLVRSEAHKVRSKKKYKGLISNEKAFKKLKKDKTSNIKIKSSKLDIKSGGMTTKVSKRDGTSLAKIGGCPVSKLKFYKRIGKEKSPFIHKSLIEAASKANKKLPSVIGAEPKANKKLPSVIEAASKSNEKLPSYKMSSFVQSPYPNSLLPLYLPLHNDKLMLGDLPSLQIFYTPSSKEIKRAGHKLGETFADMDTYFLLRDFKMFIPFLNKSKMKQWYGQKINNMSDTSSEAVLYYHVNRLIEKLAKNTLSRNKCIEYMALQQVKPQISGRAPCGWGFGNKEAFMVKPKGTVFDQRNKYSSFIDNELGKYIKWANSINFEQNIYMVSDIAKKPQYDFSQKQYAIPFGSNNLSNPQYDSGKLKKIKILSNNVPGTNKQTFYVKLTNGEAEAIDDKLDGVDFLTELSVQYEPVKSLVEWAESSGALKRTNKYKLDLATDKIQIVKWKQNNAGSLIPDFYTLLDIPLSGSATLASVPTAKENQSEKRSSISSVAQTKTTNQKTSKYPGYIKVFSTPYPDSFKSIALPAIDGIPVFGGHDSNIKWRNKTFIANLTSFGINNENFVPDNVGYQVFFNIHKLKIMQGMIDNEKLAKAIATDNFNSIPANNSALYFNYINILRSLVFGTVKPEVCKRYQTKANKNLIANDRGKRFHDCSILTAAPQENIFELNRKITQFLDEIVPKWLRWVETMGDQFEYYSIMDAGQLKYDFAREGFVFDQGNFTAHGGYDGKYINANESAPVIFNYVQPVVVKMKGAKAESIVNQSKTEGVFFKIKHRANLSIAAARSFVQKNNGSGNIFTNILLSDSIPVMTYSPKAKKDGYDPKHLFTLFELPI